MAGNTFGQALRLTTFGESHGVGLGGVIDGCPAGLTLTEADRHQAQGIGHGSPALRRV